jgi:hypothetical protein
MSLIILRSIPYVPKAPLSLPIAISSSFRNVLAPRLGHHTIELDATVLLDFLLTVGTFGFVVKLDLYVPSASDFVSRNLLDRIAERCPYLEELALLVAFVRRGVELNETYLGGIQKMYRLDTMRIVGS